MRKLAMVDLGSLLLAIAGEGAPPGDPVFPIGVWYGGGKARAPMQEPDPRARRTEWKKDLDTDTGR